MGIKTDNYPPGPCGFCGEPDTVEAWESEEWVQPAHGEGYYIPAGCGAECQNCGRSAKNIGSSSGTGLIHVYRVFGGQRGYAIALPGARFPEAMQKAGWKKYEDTMLG